jgi:dienelactone hydrolase
VVGGGLLALAAAAAGSRLGAAACWMDGAERLSAQTIDAPLAIYRRG